MIIKLILLGCFLLLPLTMKSNDKEFVQIKVIDVSKEYGEGVVQLENGNLIFLNLSAEEFNYLTIVREEKRQRIILLK